MIEVISPEAASKKIATLKEAFFIRDREAGEKVVRYTSGKYGPGKVNMEAFESDLDALEYFAICCALKIIQAEINCDTITGIHKGGVTYSRDVVKMYNRWTGRDVVHTTFDPKTGEFEGLWRVPPINEEGKPSVALLLDDVSNVGTLFRAAGTAFRARGYEVHHAAAILGYENSKYEGPPVTTVCTLRQVIAESPYPPRLKDDYLDYLADQEAWQKKLRPENIP